MALLKGRTREERVEATPLGIIRAVSVRLHERAMREWAEQLSPAFLLASVEAGAPLSRTVSAARALDDVRRSAALATVAEGLALAEHPRALAVAVDAVRATEASCAEQLLRLLQSIGPDASLVRAVHVASRRIERVRMASVAHLWWTGAVLAWLSVTGEPGSTLEEQRVWATRASELLEDPLPKSPSEAELLARATLFACTARYQARLGSRSLADERLDEAVELAERAARTLFDRDRLVAAQFDGYCVAHRALSEAARVLDRPGACGALPWCANSGALLSVPPSRDLVRRALAEGASEVDPVLLSASPLCFIVEREEDRDELRARAKVQLDPERVAMLAEDALITEEERSAAAASLARIDVIEGRVDQALAALDAIDAMAKEPIEAPLAALEQSLAALREGRSIELAPLLSLAPKSRASALSEAELLEKWGALSTDTTAAFSTASSLATALLRHSVALASRGAREEALALIDAVQRAVSDRTDARSRLVREPRIAGALVAAKLAVSDIDAALVVAMNNVGDSRVRECVPHLVEACVQALRPEAALAMLRLMLETSYVTLDDMVAAFAGAARMVGERERAEALVVAERASWSITSWLTAPA